MLFSQRKGIKPIKSVIQVESIDTDLKNALWSAVVFFYQNNESRTVPLLDELMVRFWLHYYKDAIDSYRNYGRAFQRVKQSFFDGEWYDAYDILEFIASNYPDNDSKSEFMDSCNIVLETELSAYRFVGGLITQITSEAEINAIEDALNDTQRIKPVHEHLNTALDYLSDRKTPDYRNSIKESISAVESICNLIAGGSKTTLAQALKAIESKVQLHPALKKAFENLYGYTSDASGIRHALLTEPNLDFEDAKFMLVSCSAFINYLISKAAKAGITF